MSKEYVTVRKLGSSDTKKIEKTQYNNQVITARLLSGVWTEAPDADFHELVKIAMRNLDFKGMIDIDNRGIRYDWDNLEGTGFSQPDDLVKYVASIFATSFPDGLSGKLKRWGSYGVKHDLENVLIRCNNKICYVSNGYGIVGFIHYLLNVLHVPETELGLYVKQQLGYDRKPVTCNVDFMLPSSYIKTLGSIKRK